MSYTGGKAVSKWRNQQYHRRALGGPRKKARTVKYRANYSRTGYGHKMGSQLQSSYVGSLVPAMYNWGSAIAAPRYITKMAFSESWIDTTAIPGFAAYAWRANDLFDPDVALGGVSAPGLKALANLYKFYKVLDCQIEVDLINNDADDPVHVAAVPTLDGANTVAAADADSLQGLPNTSHMIVCNQTGQGKLVNKHKTSLIFGVRNLDDAGFIAATNASPAHLWYWQTYFWNQGSHALLSEITVRLITTVEFSGLNNQALSDI